MSKTNVGNAPTEQPSYTAGRKTEDVNLTLIEAEVGGEGFLLNNQVCFALYSATQAIVNAYGPLLAETGLTYSQYLVMLVLWEEDGLTVQEMCLRLYLDVKTLNRLLKRLQRLGFLWRERVAEKKHPFLIRLTDEGRTLREPMAEVQAKVSCRTHLSVAELISLTHQISQLRDTLLCSE